MPEFSGVVGGGESSVFAIGRTWRWRLRESTTVLLGLPCLRFQYASGSGNDLKEASSWGFLARSTGSTDSLQGSRSQSVAMH